MGGLRELTQCAFDTSLMCTLYAYMCLFDEGIANQRVMPSSKDAEVTNTCRQHPPNWLAYFRQYSWTYYSIFRGPVTLMKSTLVVLAGHCFIQVHTYFPLHLSTQKKINPEFVCILEVIFHFNLTLVLASKIPDQSDRAQVRWVHHNFIGGKFLIWMDGWEVYVHMRRLPSARRKISDNSSTIWVVGTDGLHFSLWVSALIARFCGWFSSTRWLWNLWMLVWSWPSL